MKKIILTAAVLVIASVCALAQPRAIGLRAGYGWDVSYQHNLGNNFLECDLGLTGGIGFSAAAVYDFKIAEPNWTKRGTWCFYAGPGVNFVGKTATQNSYAYTAILIGGQVGLEYGFEGAPINLSFDWRPMFGPGFYNGSTYFNHSATSVALSVRYRF